MEYWSSSILQVNLFQKPSFLHQLTHNMRRDCSLNSPEKYKFRTCCVQKLLFLFLFWHSKQYLYTTCSELVFFGEFNELWVQWGLLKKIYLYWLANNWWKKIIGDRISFVRSKLFLGQNPCHLNELLNTYIKRKL